MSVIKKSDVKNHLSRRNRTGIHLYRPEVQPDATGFSGDGIGSAAVNSRNSAENTLMSGMSNGMNLPATSIAPNSSGSLELVVPKSPQK